MSKVPSPEPTPGVRWEAVRERLRRYFWALVVLAALLTAWEVSVDRGLMDPLFASSPSEIVRQAFNMYLVTGEIYRHLLVSAQEVALGLGLAIAIGIPVGLLVGCSRTAAFLLEPYLAALNSTPVVALLPVIVLWAGVGLWSKVLLILLGCIFGIIWNTQAGVMNADPRLLEMARAFTASQFKIFTRVILPESLPFILAGLRTGVGRALIMVFVAEMYSASEGIGFLVVRAGTTFEVGRLFVGVLTLTLSGVLITHALRILEERVVPWMPSSDDRKR